YETYARPRISYSAVSPFSEANFAPHCGQSLLASSLRPVRGHGLVEELVTELVIGRVLRVPLIERGEVALIVEAKIGHGLLPFLPRAAQRRGDIGDVGLLRGLVRQRRRVLRHLLLHVIVEGFDGPVVVLRLLDR